MFDDDHIYQRNLNESVYDYEDRLIKAICGDDVCGQRTANGAPWAMPCTLKAGHDGDCTFDCPDGFYFRILHYNESTRTATMSKLNTSTEK